MTIVYPITIQFDYTELKYSLRSLEKFLPGSHEVVIVSDYLPEWLTGVTQLCVGDVKGKKQVNIKQKISAALNHSSRFLFMNDDIYFLKLQVEFPYCWHGMLKTYQEPGTRSLEKRLIELGKPVKHFDGHYPIMYHAQFNEVLTKFPADTIIKSMYCNYFEIEGEFMADCKIMKAMKFHEIEAFARDKPCISTSLFSVASVIPYLNQLFPDKSKYEV